MMKVVDVSSGYGAVPVLHGVSLEVKPGELVTLVGSNGAGKSTLLKTISGLLRPSAGKVLFGERSLGGMAPEVIARMGVLQVPEGRQLFGSLTVLDNLKLASLAARKRFPQLTEAEALAPALELFPILAQREHQLAGSLSGGQQQMLAIGRALVGRPEVLMLDEPSFGLAPQVIQEIFSSLVRLKQQGMAVLLVEQSARAALQVADRGYVMQNGKIALEGPAQQLLQDEQVQTAYLGV